MSVNQVLPLRRLFRIVNGGTPTSEGSNWNGNVPWGTPADFGENLTDLRETRRTLTEHGADTGSAIAPAGSILLSTRAPIGYVALAAVPMAFNQGCRALVPTGDADTRFFGYQLESMRGQLQARGLGSTFVELSSDSLAAFPVHAPGVDQQRRIAHFLDKETARIDALSRRRRQMKELLTLRRDRAAEEILNLEGAGEASARAPLKYRAGMVTVGIVITPAKLYVEHGGVPALRGVNVAPGVITTDELATISEEGHAANQKSALRTGDVVVVRTGQAGAAAVVPNEFDGWNCIDLIVVRPGDDLSPRYVQYVLNSTYARRRVAEHSVGSIQAHFNISAMKQVPFPVLPRHEQEQAVKALDERLEPIDRLSGTLTRQESALTERRQALITAAVTGEFDVSTARGRGTGV